MRVGAAAVNYPDVLLVANQYQISVPPPFVVGSEFAGVIVEVAGETGDLVVGDRVTGTQMFGAFAEEVVVAATALARIPPGIDDRTAAAFGVAYRTAYHALRSVARIDSGDAVVVLGAGGGVGLAAVQLACRAGRRRHRRRIVGRKARRSSVIRCQTCDQSSHGRSARGVAGRRCPTARTPSSTPSAATCPSPRFDR